MSEKRHKQQRREARPLATSNESGPSFSMRVQDWLFAPQPIARLELIRFLVPLAVLGFVSSRVIHADDWLSTAGFHVPDLGRADWRQPLYLRPLPPAMAWVTSGALVGSGLLLAAGAWTRVSALAFAVTLGYVTLADRLAAFTVTKMGTVLAVALWFSPCGARWSVDRWRRARQKVDSPPAPTHVGGGSVRFFQILVAVFYCASGIGKIRGDWLTHPAVIWTHLHDSYQTSVAYFTGRIMPAWGWLLLQVITLAFEALAPLWFAFRRTRSVALGWAIGMHMMIALMFGPLCWFSLLMISLLLACFGPARWFDRPPVAHSTPAPLSPAFLPTHHQS